MTGKEDERPIHKVTITSFWIGKYEVTQGQYRAVMGSGAIKSEGQVLSDDHPVVYVSWYDAIEFCNKLSAKEQLEPVYEIASNGEVRADFSKNGYRLPTEAEWEYACRAGTTGEQYGELDDIAWYWKNSEDQTHPVAKMQSNAWGMYDMLGNVWEWCADVYGGYPSVNVMDPRGPASGERRVLRGGAWSDYLFGYYYFGSFTRSANRGWDYPDRRHVNYGFRCARD